MNDLKVITFVKQILNVLDSPVITISDQSALSSNGWYRLSDYLNVSDGDGDQITKYKLFESGGAKNWRADGQYVEATSGYEPQNNDLSTIWFQAKYYGGSETLGVAAYDGKEWSDTVSFTVSTVSLQNSSPAGAVTVSGILTEGETLTAVTSTIDYADGLGSFGYQWLRDGSSITGATSSTHVLTQSDVGTEISVTVSYTDGYGTSESLTSSATSSVANANDSPTGLVTLTGTATEGETLTAVTSTIADADGLGSFGYQWLRDGSSINGATSSTYTLKQSDVGAKISVTVSYTDGSGTVESLTSEKTDYIYDDNGLQPCGGEIMPG